MTITSYREVLRRSWILVILAPLIGAFVGFGLSKAALPVYQAQAAVFVSIDSAGGATSALTPQQRMDGYTGLPTSPDVLDVAAKALPNYTSSTELVGRVSASVKPATTVLTVSSTAPTADEAAAVANAVAASTAAEISRRGSQEIVVRTSGGKDQTGKIVVRGDVVTMATSPSAPISPRTRANTALGFLLGLIVGITVPVLRESLAPKVRDPNGLEESAGAPFLGKARQGQWTGDLTLVRASLLTQSNLEPPSCLVVAAVDASPNAAPVAAGLASALALEGTRVLLVDADTPSPTSGLSELLSGAYTVDGTLGSAADGAYDIMRAESLGDKPTSFELHALCDSLKQKYDWVLVLAPAFKDHADAVLLAGAADGAVVVADQHRTSVKATTEVGDVLRRTGARVLGSVLV